MLPPAELMFAVRVIHVVAALGWFGEVLVVNFVLVPALQTSKPGERVALLGLAFPRVFWLATILGGLAIGTGVILMLWYTQFHFQLLIGSRWGWFISIGGALGAALYAFHLFQESRAERSLASNLTEAVKNNDLEAAAWLLRKLSIFPRVGGTVLLASVVLMIAARNLP